MAAALHAQKVHTPPAVANPGPVRPDATIPVGPLGYMPPGDLPAYNYALVELHFLDANHLLFVFNIPSLLKRDNDCPVSDSQRMVRAVVLQLPSGHVLKQADWELYDFNDYLWGLDDGQLLLRRCTRLNLVGADLELHPLIQASGAIEDVSFSPDRSIAEVEEKVAPAAAQDSGTVPSILERDTLAPQTRVDFIRMHPLEILARTKVPLSGAIPITAEGIFEVLDAPHDRWVINLQAFHGPQRPIATIHSLCGPGIRPITNSVLMVTTCPKADKEIYQGYDLQGSLLWEIPLQENQFMPRLIVIPQGAHFAIESLRLKRPHASLDPLTKDDVVGEDIDIYDTLTGVRTATFETTPVYIAGRNVDFSPDGTRMAVLHNGVIEIYTLSELAKAPRGPSR